jgi:hypothetical protein
MGSSKGVSGIVLSQKEEEGRAVIESKREESVGPIREKLLRQIRRRGNRIVVDESNWQRISVSKGPKLRPQNTKGSQKNLVVPGKSGAEFLSYL